MEDKSAQEVVPSNPEEQSWLNDLERVDQLMAQEDLKNAKYRKRLLFLIPFNFFAIYGTMVYFRNIQRIARRFWPNRQKATVMNFFLVGTAQAIFLTSFYLGGTILVLGINPVAIWKRREQLVGGPTDEELMQSEQEIE